MVNLKRNLSNSLSGLNYALSEKSFRAELALGIVLIPIMLVSSTAQLGFKLAAIGTYVLLLAFELINTAIERLCDRVTTEHDSAIKAVKDLASAAVFLILILFLLQCVLLIFGIPKF